MQALPLAAKSSERLFLDNACSLKALSASQRASFLWEHTSLPSTEQIPTPISTHAFFLIHRDDHSGLPFVLPLFFHSVLTKFKKPAPGNAN